MAQVMDETAKVVHDVQGDMIPRLYSLRRVPNRYRQIIPLSVMKRYQCMVVGGAGGKLTVAIADQKGVSIFHALSQITGCAIFPVLVDPVRMRLLLQRIERAEHEHYSTLRRFSSLQRLQARVLLSILAHQLRAEH